MLAGHAHLGGVRPVRSPCTITSRARQARNHFLWHHVRPLSSGLNWVDLPVLCLRLQTGLDQMLKAAKLVLPIVDRARSLLAELDKDPERRGLARLTRSLMAAVSLPQPLSEHDDLPLGGVSDITTRGQLDRLPLSELAQDDLMFILRLALNELLYLRRETPPRPQAETRHTAAGLRTAPVGRPTHLRHGRGAVADRHQPQDRRRKSLSGIGGCAPHRRSAESRRADRASGELWNRRCIRARRFPRFSRCVTQKPRARRRS